MIIRKVFACMLAFAVVVAMSAVMLTEPVSAASLSTPVMTIHAASATSIQVSWKKVSGATNYVVYVSKASDKALDESATVNCYPKKTLKSSKRTYVVKGLTKKKYYAVFVRAEKVVKGKVKAKADCLCKQCTASTDC